MPVLAYFHQAIAESGSALSGWAFDSSPESHAHEIASTHLGCPTDSTTALVGCSHISSNSTCVCAVNIIRFISSSQTWFLPPGELSEEWEDFPGHCPCPWKICGEQMCGYVKADIAVVLCNVHDISLWSMFCVERGKSSGKDGFWRINSMRSGEYSAKHITSSQQHINF